MPSGGTGRLLQEGDFMEKETAIYVEDVSKTYQNGEVPVPVLNHVSFTVQAGELLAVTGDSGSGKTTLMNLLGALDTPDSGRIIIGRQVISNMSQHQRTLYRRNSLGFIYQDFNLIQVLNVYENIVLPLQLGKKKIEEKKIDFMLEKLRLLDKKYALPSQLSGGEQQRVAIARALVNQPKILLADEPTGNLDNNNAWEIMKLLEDINSNGTTVVVVTHNLEIVREMRKRVITIEKGIVVSDEQQADDIFGSGI